MPIIPPSSSAPYDSVEYVLNLARSIINDAGSPAGLSGNLLSDAQPYTITYLNSAYRLLQDDLADNGVETFVKEAILLNVAPVASLDPASQCYIDFVAYFDGVNTNNSPVLPQDLIVPLRLWERQNGTQAAFIDMYPANDGISSAAKTGRLYQWEWRTDKIYLVGSTNAQDIRLRYNAYLPELVIGGPLAIFRSSNVLAYIVAGIFAQARGSPLADTFMAKAQDLTQKMINRMTRKSQRGNHRRLPYSSRRGSQWESL